MTLPQRQSRMEEHIASRSLKSPVKGRMETTGAAILILIFLASFGFAQSPSAAAIKRADALVSETIPHLKLTNATFEQAIGFVQRVWSEKHPAEPLPIGLTAFMTPQGYRNEYPAHITLELKDVPFIEALRYIADLSGRGFSVRQGLPQFEHVTWIEEGWVTRLHEITPEVLAGLKLDSSSGVEDIRHALAKVGISLEIWMKPRLVDGGSTLAVTSYTPQQEQIAGVIALLRSGYKISK